MIFSVTRAMERAEGGAFDGEGLPGGNVLPVVLRVAFVDLGMRGVREKIWNAFDVVVMPVR